MSKLDFSKFDAIESIKYRDYDGEIKEIVPHDALAFSSENIPFETQAITYYTVSQIMEQANLSLEDAKLSQSKLHAKLYLQYAVSEALIKANKGRKPTDAMINASIDLNDDYIKVSKLVTTRRMKYNVLKNLFKAFEQRKDLMQSISAQKRAENNIQLNTASDANINKDLGPSDFDY